MSVYTDKNGNEQRLGLIPPDDRAIQLRKACGSFTEHLRSKGLSLVPKSKYRDVHNTHFRDNKFKINQGQTSSCVGASSVAAYAKKRYSTGLRFERLSAPFVYAHINGGRDAGAMITDAMTAISKYGVCLESEMNYPKIFLNQITDAARESAMKRQSLAAIPIDEPDEFYSAIQLGFFPVFGVHVDGNFEEFDRNGVSQATSGWANHAVHADGMTVSDLSVDLPNTWYFDWGPFGDGSCRMRAKGINLTDAYVILDVEM